MSITSSNFSSDPSQSDPSQYTDSEANFENNGDERQSGHLDRDEKEDQSDDQPAIDDTTAAHSNTQQISSKLLVCPPLKPFAQFPRCSTTSSKNRPPDPPPGFYQFADFDGSVRILPASTWLDRNAAEIRISKALDKSESRDLGVHLYNVWSLKRKIERGDEVLGGGGREGVLKRRKKVARDRGDEGDEEDEGGKGESEGEDEVTDTVRAKGRKGAWMPPKAWTAWPMKPEVVPREWEREKWADNDSYMKLKGLRELSESSRSGRQVKVLEEVVLSQILKQSTQRFREREWEDHEQQSSCSEALKDVQCPTVLQDDEVARSILRPTIGGIFQQINAVLIGLHHQRAAYTARPTGDSEDELGLGRRRISRSVSRISMSRPRPRKGKGEGKDKGKKKVKVGSRLKSRISVTNKRKKENDDKEDRASSRGRQRVPISARIRSKSRAGGHSRANSTQHPHIIKYDNTTDPPFSPADSAYEGTSSSPTHSSANAGSSTSSSRAFSATPNAPPSPASPTPPPQRGRRSGAGSSPSARRAPRTRLNLRDWSDVLNVASLTGCFGDVVERASGRLEGLFGEAMKGRWVLDGGNGSGEEQEVEGIEQSGEEGDGEQAKTEDGGRIAQEEERKESDDDVEDNMDEDNEEILGPQS